MRHRCCHCRWEGSFSSNALWLFSFQLASLRPTEAVITTRYIERRERSCGREKGELVWPIIDVKIWKTDVRRWWERWTEERRGSFSSLFIQRMTSIRRETQSLKRERKESWQEDETISWEKKTYTNARVQETVEGFPAKIMPFSLRWWWWWTYGVERRKLTAVFLLPAPTFFPTDSLFRSRQFLSSPLISVFHIHTSIFTFPSQQLTSLSHTLTHDLYTQTHTGERTGQRLFCFLSIVCSRAASSLIMW